MRSNQRYFVLRSVLLFFLAGSTIGCTNTKNKKDSTPLPVKQLVFDKLAGTWQSEDGKNFERWTKNDDGTFRSVAFNVKGNDTSWNEEANIYPENDNWIFENKVKGQNEDKAVKFISSSLSDYSVQFSNPTHDFPTDVNYTVVNANTVYAFIVGPNKNGGKDTILFKFTRVR